MTQPARALSRYAAAPWAAAVATGAFVTGVGLATVGVSAGPLVMVELVVLVLLAAAVLDRPLLGVGLVLLAIPIGLRSVPAGFTFVQVTAVLAVGAAAVTHLASGQAPVRWAPMLWWGVLVTALFLMSTPNALDTTAALKQDGDVALGVALVLTTLTVVSNLHEVRRLVHLLVAVGAGVCVVSLTQAGQLHSVSQGAAVDNRLQGTFTEPNQFGGFAAIVVVLALGVALGALTRRERVLALTALVPAALALLLALSRGAWLGTLIALVLVVWLLPAVRKPFVAVLALLIVLLPSVGLLAPDVPQVKVVRQRIGTVGAPVANPYDSRPAIWREAQREIDAHPWLGVGPGQFPLVSQEAASPAASVYAEHAHNVLLTVAAEGGIPAAGALIGFTLGMLVVLRRVVRRLAGTPHAPVVAAVGASLGVVIGQGLVDFTLRNSVIFLLLSVLVGLVLGADRLTREAIAPAAR